MTRKNEPNNPDQTGYEDLLADAEDRYEKDRKQYAKNPPDTRSRDAMDDYAGGFLLSSLWIGRQKWEQFPREKRPLRVIVPDIQDIDDAKFLCACMESVTRQRLALEHVMGIDAQVAGPRLWISSAIGSVVSGAPTKKERGNIGSAADRRMYEALGEILMQLQEKEDELRTHNKEFRRAG